jgi:uncharacterized membrane protein
VDVSGAALAVGASQFANVFESWLGATSQGKKGLEWVRRLNPWSSCLLCLIVYHLPHVLSFVIGQTQSLKQSEGVWMGYLVKAAVSSLRPISLLQLSNDLVNVFNISLGTTIAIVLRVLLSNL